MPFASLLTALAEVPDPRRAQGQRVFQMTFSPNDLAVVTGPVDPTDFKTLPSTRSIRRKAELPSIPSALLASTLRAKRASADARWRHPTLHKIPSMRERR